MKWLWALIISLFGFNVIPTLPAPTPTPAETVKYIKTVEFKNTTYAYSYFAITHSTTLTLIPNFSHPKEVQSIMSDHACTSGINGGFYDKNNRPLGYFQSDDRYSGARIESELFNGFLWADASGSAVISSDLPLTTFHFALQTGPMLMFDGKTLLLSINNDMRARRMVAAKNNELMFITVYNADSVFDGPLLADLPRIIQLISTKENLDISEAINLDGGSASAFYSGDTKLSELTPVGSIFCYNQLTGR